VAFTNSFAPDRKHDARMRAWRALKASGAAVLRDGVYLLPDQGNATATLTGIVDDVRENGGTAYLLPTTPENNTDFPAFFDRPLSSVN
jgi:hypothetical protein